MPSPEPFAATLHQAADHMRADHPGDAFWTALADHLDAFGRTEFDPAAEEPGMTKTWDQSHVRVNAVATAYLAGWPREAWSGPRTEWSWGARSTDGPGMVIWPAGSEADARAQVRLRDADTAPGWRHAVLRTEVGATVEAGDDA